MTRRRGRRERRGECCCSVSRSWVFCLQTSAALLSSSWGRTPLPPPTMIVSLWVSKSDLLLLLLLRLLPQTRDDHLAERLREEAGWWDGGELYQKRYSRSRDGLPWNQNTCMCAKFILPILSSNNMSTKSRTSTLHPCSTLLESIGKKHTHLETWPWWW